MFTEDYVLTMGLSIREGALPPWPGARKIYPVPLLSSDAFIQFAKASMGQSASWPLGNCHRWYGLLPAMKVQNADKAI